MLVYNSITDLFNDIRLEKNLDEYDFVYFDKKQWDDSPSTTKLFLPTFEESEEWNDEHGLPVIVVEKGLSSMLSTADLEDVVLNFLSIDPTGDVEGLIEAINYYREFDSFKTN